MSIQTKLNKHKAMGVINITPNSFSDANKHKDSNTVLESIENFRSHGISIFDFGAESTAPFNNEISSEEELSRFSTFLYPLLENNCFEDDEVLSIDTYKVDTFVCVYEKIRSNYPTIKILWNDVSGKISEEVITLLKKDSLVSYVLSHNLCPSRAQTNSHMDYIDRTLGPSSLVDFFRTSLSKFDLSKVSKQIILDPCFGFSKTIDQNLELIKELELIISSLSDYRWMIGVSKKSFLQKLTGLDDKLEAKKDSEFIHSALLSSWMSKFKKTDIIFRVHDPIVFSYAQKSSFLI